MQEEIEKKKDGFSKLIGFEKNWHKMKQKIPTKKSKGKKRKLFF